MIPFLNPQTTAFCNLIGIENKINAQGQQPIKQSPAPPAPSQQQQKQCPHVEISQGEQVPEPHIEDESQTTPCDSQMVDQHEESTQAMESPSKKARLDE